MSFIGRHYEIELLRQANWRKHARLTVVYGRRRIGKTALIQYAFKDQPFWKFEGLENETLKNQINNFMHQLSGYCQNIKLSKAPVKNWHQALVLLDRELKKRKRLTVFFDEFQWLADMKPNFVSLFKLFWDNHFSKHSGLHMVLCGSVSSFMVKNVLRSRALYGRVDTEIHLKALALPEIKLFFAGQRQPQEILDSAMVMGGIPQYLLQLDPKLSLMQNLGELAFRQHGYFFQEYQRLFISHFGLNQQYENILKQLIDGAKNTERLAKGLHNKSGGTFSKLLSDLELAGFIDRYSPIDRGAKSKQVLYRISDEYLHFYFRFIHPNISAIVSGKLSPFQVLASRDYQQWQGYAFERLCLKHAAVIADHLRFSGLKYQAGSWFNTRTPQHAGIQIDLLFERADKILTVCELKYTDKLDATKIIGDFEKKCLAMAAVYPKHGVQKVLILGRKIAVHEKVKRYFDSVLFAEDVFLT